MLVDAMIFTIYVNIHNGYGCAEQSLPLRARYLFCTVLPSVSASLLYSLTKPWAVNIYFYSLSQQSYDRGIIFHQLREAYMLRGSVTCPKPHGSHKGQSCNSKSWLHSLSFKDHQCIYFYFLKFLYGVLIVLTTGYLGLNILDLNFVRIVCP